MTNRKLLSKLKFYKSLLEIPIIGNIQAYKNYTVVVLDCRDTTVEPNVANAHDVLAEMSGTTLQVAFHEKI